MVYFYSSPNGLRHRPMAYMSSRRKTRGKKRSKEKTGQILWLGSCLEEAWISPFLSFLEGTEEKSPSHTRVYQSEICYLWFSVIYLQIFNQKPTNKQKEKTLDFPGGGVVKNLPANAGDTGSSPGLGRSHRLWSNWAREPQLLSLCSRARKPQLLSPRATTTEACAPRACAPQQEKPPQWEARTPQLRVDPLAATRESPRTATKTQLSQK